MENISLILDWIESSSCSIFKNSWTEEYSKDIHHYSIESEYNGLKISGQGLSEQSEELAIIKAFSEFSERMAMEENNLANSNGLSCHTSLENATKNAFNELIERDAFFYFFENDLSFPEYEVCSLKSFSPTTLKLYESFKSKGVEQSFYSLPTPTKDNVIVYISSGIEAGLFGMIIGASYGRSNNAEHAFLEAAFDTHWAILNNQNIKTISINEFRQKKTISIDDHFFLGLNIPYAKEFKHKFLTKNETHTRAKVEIETHVNQLPSSILDEARVPFVVVQVSAPKLKSFDMGGMRSEFPHCFS